MKILVKKLNEKACITKFEQGDWFDLSFVEPITIKKGTVTHIPLGIAMKLPKGMEALMLPRHSTPLKRGFTLANSVGVIDNSYCGDTDEWQFPAYSIRNVKIEPDENPYNNRICQFKIVPSQKATIFQKLKWLFNRKIKFVYVDNLNTKARGEFNTDKQ